MRRKCGALEKVAQLIRKLEVGWQRNDKQHEERWRLANNRVGNAQKNFLDAAPKGENVKRLSSLTSRSKADHRV